MKNKILLTVCMLTMFGYIYGSTDAENTASEKKSLTVYCTPDVQYIAETLIQQYSLTNKDLNFDIKQVASEGFGDELKQKNSLGFISEKSNASNSTELWKMLIARHIVVPVTNIENPNLDILEEKGISIKELQETIIRNKKESINIYVYEDESVQCLANFLGFDPESVANFKVHTKEEMIQKLKKDKTAVGFCCLLDITKEIQEEFASIFKILPIDKNENGHVDYHELVYRPVGETELNSGNLTVHETTFGSLDAFERGMWIGKYPRSLVNDLYIVLADFPEESEVSDFISWTITAGQDFFVNTTFNELVYSERQSKLNDLQPVEVSVEPTQQYKSTSKSFLYIIIGLITVTLIFGIVISYRKRKASGKMNVFPGHSKVLNEDNLEIPNGIYFDKTHTWSFMEKDGSVKIGIDDFMQNVTGQYSKIKMKNPGEKIIKNESLVTLVQDGKQIEIYAPISGKIKEINEDLVTDPSQINKSPYSEGWIYSIEPANWQREISFLKMADSYKIWIKNEISRLKDFLAIMVNVENNQQIAFQEGGELYKHVLKEFGPRAWEDFQKNFIDNSDLN